MRFGQGPGSFLWPVRWYRTSKPFIPFPNVYNSHNWIATPRPEDDTGEPGEVFGRDRPWRNGSAPPPSMGTGWKGDAAAWAGSLDGPRYTPCTYFPLPEEGAFDYGYNWGYDVSSL